MKVELLNFYPFEVSTRRPRLLGYADVEIEDLVVIRGIKLFENRHGGYFILMPEFDTEKRRAVVEIKDKNLLERIRRVVIDYYKEQMSQKN